VGIDNEVPEIAKGECCNDVTLLGLNCGPVAILENEAKIKIQLPKTHNFKVYWGVEIEFRAHKP
jgi:hypothetical protein